MKKALLILSALFLLFTVIPTESFGQVKSIKQYKKEQKKLQKQVKDKAIKMARKEAKRMKKEEGWGIYAGTLPIEKQLEKSWTNQYEMKYDNDGNSSNAYLWATGTSVARTDGAALMVAITNAKVALAGELKTFVAALTTSNIANSQLSVTDAETEQITVQSAKLITSATLTNVKPVIKIVRRSIPRKGLKKNNKQQLAKGTVEVQVMLFYSTIQADILSRKAIKEELKDKLKDNEAELKKLMDL